MDTAPVKIVEGTPFKHAGEYIAIGPAALLTDAHAHQSPVTVETGDAEGDQVILLNYRPYDRADTAPYGEIKRWTADRGPYAGQELAMYLVNTTGDCLADAPLLAKRIAEQNSRNSRAYAEREARVAAEEAELTRPAD